MEKILRLFEVFEVLKKAGRIKNYVELASVLKTNKAGINDLKSGRKKLSAENIESVIISYPDINPEWLLMGNGQMFRTVAKESIRIDHNIAKKIVGQQIGNDRDEDKAEDLLLQKTSHLTEQLVAQQQIIASLQQQLGGKEEIIASQKETILLQKEIIAMLKQAKN